MAIQNNNQLDIPETQTLEDTDEKMPAMSNIRLLSNNR